jgi:glycosyltransferase involved in cell wall biosynthesis
MTSAPTTGPDGRLRRRVDLLLPSLNPGGAQQVYLTMANLLADHHDVRLVVVDTSGPLRREIPRDVELVDLKCTGVSRALPALVRHLRRRRPAVLLPSIDHTNMLAMTAAVLARTGVTVLPRVANTLSRSQADQSMSTRMIRVGSRALYPRARAVIVPADGVATDLVALGVPETSVRVIPNPVVGPSLVTAAAEPITHPWFDGAAPRTPVAVAMGRLVPQKDFCVLLDAFARVRARRDLRLVILGEGALRESLAQQAKEAGVADDLDMPGYVHNPAPYLARADLFVLSSRWEGLPGALIQALACGTQVVATDCESGPREILEGGRFGRLVPVGDATAMAGAIEGALDEPMTPEEAAWRPYTEASSLGGYLELIDEFSP